MDSTALGDVGDDGLVARWRAWQDGADERDWEALIAGPQDEGA